MLDRVSVTFANCIFLDFCPSYQRVALLVRRAPWRGERGVGRGYTAGRPEYMTRGYVRRPAADGLFPRVALLVKGRDELPEGTGRRSVVRGI